MRASDRLADHIGIAPTRRLRAVVNRHNSLLTPDCGNGEPRGLPVELASELATTLGLGLHLQFVNGASAALAAVASSSADIGFLAIDPSRSDQVDFSIPFAEFEGVYLARANELASLREVDAPGIRVAVLDGSGPALHLTRLLKSATLCRFPAVGVMISALTALEVDVVAGHRHILETEQSKVNGLVILPGSFKTIGQAICIPKGRPEALRYINSFVHAITSQRY